MLFFYLNIFRYGEYLTKYKEKYFLTLWSVISFTTLYLDLQQYMCSSM
jgi:hypothetical protein